MRPASTPVRAVLVALATTALAVLWPAVASAQPAPVDACVMNDKRLNELSGLVSDGENWYAVNDGGTKSTVYVLSRETCKVQDVISGPVDPFDVEDLARGADGTFWLSDTGDNGGKRETVALIALTPGGKATLHRLTYPDGAHDTETLLVDKNGVPYLVAKSPFGVSDVYRPKGPLSSPGPTVLEHLGSVQIEGTDTKGGPVNPIIGSMAVTGGSVSADGNLVALRTYTDAYVFSAPGGDVAAALLKGTAARIPLAGEKQGEAIAFQPDGSLVSASEGVGQPIRVVPGAAALAPAAGGGSTTAPKSSEGAAAAADGVQAVASEDNGLSTLPALGVTAVAVGGILFVMHRRAVRRS
ncbi:hypothetical protein [Actinokineospora sp. PR83]|uniref:hypothetical protein n=1 Tax=Actinokineospora sp. PR83 TaxID=2884908 RepID=UPI0035AB741F